MKIRVRFAKLGKIRWSSHRDVARMWERAFRREQLPLAYSEGFSPRPKVSFGLALPTGHESLAEYLDIELDATLDLELGAGAEQLDLEALPARLSAALPLGVDVLAVAPLEARAPSLQEDVTSCTWRLAAIAADGHAAVGEEEMAARVAALLAAPSAMVARSRKGVEVVDDVRPGIIDLRVLGATEAGVGEGVWLEAELGTRPRGVRPSELLGALGPDLAEAHVRRLHQWISRDGARWEPLGLGGTTAATDAPHALERAS
ncbi:TIGR03936 family radical SAM-associated protein [Acidiferrimicrobium sp. IK]|uniref:TIGR03936 family radical SAM-associated protein n=1 Tax=Acidiferrimicrobium sp. IK TaxID=2871700 RepID=UPI0021CB03C2|nr:TIGR03936 family radical SAM-associated protein [Acidiferrimicrobium sp. IK]MCU4185497.1 TIGR03936 family radical SAM-associated protein [Acidiferrimicrobium sp. IK]